MANYTMELRRVCEIFTREEVENWFKSYKLEDYLLPEQLILVKNTSIWNKDRLAKKIVNHYFMREIGFETPALFKLNAIQFMEEIMEEKLPYIYTIALEYDPLVNVDFTETFKRNATSNSKNSISSDTINTGTSNSFSNGNSSGRTVNNQTPQNQLTKEQVLSGEYATSITGNENENNIKDNTTTNSNSSSSQNSNLDNENEEEYTRHLKGNQRNFGNLSSYD